MPMFARPIAVVKLAALTLLLSAAAAPVAGAQSAPVQSVDNRPSYRSNRVLTKVVIYGSIGAIVGALGSLRKRGGAEATLNDEETPGR
jgi:hypothetical protein